MCKSAVSVDKLLKGQQYCYSISDNVLFALTVVFEIESMALDPLPEARRAEEMVFTSTAANQRIIYGTAVIEFFFFSVGT